VQPFRKFPAILRNPKVHIFQYLSVWMVEREMKSPEMYVMNAPHSSSAFIYS
jgi:hypothetical protein